MCGNRKAEQTPKSTGQELDLDIWAFLEAGEGQVPQRYIDYQIMKQMGWSYQELMATPDSVVRDILRYMNTEGKHYKHRSE